MSQPIEAVLLGAGSRGYEAYGAFALRHPQTLRFVAVAEPDEARRARFAQAHGLPPERCFPSWEDLLAAGRLAPALVNCTMDQMHVASTLAALQVGYHVLLEKPMAPNPYDCVRLVRAAEQRGRLLMICHVLRYTPFFSTLHDCVQSGCLGEVITVEHKENVAFWHMAHSYVRGNWGKEEESAPMLLAKCCHDLDIFVWVLDRKCTRVSSFGSLTHFRPENAPPGSTARCTDGCPVEPNCPYSALKQYLGPHTGWPTSVISVDTSLEARLEALKTGPYGRCVFRCDNDVVDHQVTNLEFEGGLTVSFTMHGHSHDNVRTLRYSGTRATLRGHEGAYEITIHDYLTGRVDHINPGHSVGGHGGGDTGLLNAFVQAMRDPAGAAALTSGRNSLESHLLAFAAEKARREGTVVDMEKYRQEIEAAVAEDAGERG